MKEFSKNLSLTEKEKEIKNNITFKEEARERLAELEAALLDLENAPRDPDLIDRAFRAMHTIKGSGGMFGFEDIVKFTHNIETIFEKIREGSVTLDRNLIALTLSAHDQIHKMLDNPKDTDINDCYQRETITRVFGDLIHNNKSMLREDPSDIQDPTALENQKWSTYRIRFKPLPGIFQNGTNPLLLINEVRKLGDCQIIPHVSDIPELTELYPEKCYIWWDLILNTSQGQQAIRDIFIFVEEVSDIRIELIDSDTGISSEAHYKRLGEILVDRGDLNQWQLQNVLNEHKRLGEELERKGLVEKTQIKSALAEQNIVKSNREKRRRTEFDKNIRVSSGKIEQLIHLIERLEETQAQLNKIATNHQDPSIVQISLELEKLSSDFRKTTKRIKMLSFGSLFCNYKRLVRDLSFELNKEVSFVAEGGKIEIDKKILELLNDPIIHILRNSVDHGIEAPDGRKKLGKSPVGTIKISASTSEAHLTIKISDDGAGIDTEKIQRAAANKGLIPKTKTITEQEAYNLIYNPGFSTAERVTKVSGRGFGMDIVQQTIDDLEGSISIVSTPGKGTDFVIKLPIVPQLI